MKRTFVIVLTLLMVLSLCACGEKEDATTDVVETPAPTDVIATLDPTDAVETYIKSYVESNNILTGYDIDGKSVTVYTTDNSVDFIVMTLAMGNEESLQNWNNLTSSTDGVSVNFLQGISALGMDDAEVNVQLTSPIDSNIVYYTTTNGTPVFNINEFVTGSDVDGKSVTIYTSLEEADAIVEGLAADDKECHSRWEDLTSTINGISASFSKSATKLVADCEVSVQFTSSGDSSVVYYIAKNGTQVFNIADAEATDTAKVQDAAKAEDAAKAIDDIKFYPADAYKVGVDLEPGEYYFIPTEVGLSSYIVAYSDSNGKEILANALSTGAVYMTVEAGQYLEVSHAKFCFASDYPCEITDTIATEGMYLVGKDIKPGEYKLTNTSENFDAYYCLYSSSDVNKDIVSNSLFEKSSYVTVQEGQYLELSACVGSLVS